MLSRLTFFLLFPRGVFIMGCRIVDFMNFAVKLDGLNMLGFSTGISFFVVVWPLGDILVGVLLQCLALL